MTSNPHRIGNFTGIVFATAALLLFAAGCGHKTRTVYAPPPPPITAPSAPSKTPPPSLPGAPAPAAPPAASSEQDAEFVATHEPIFSETGMASWYGPPYHNRRGANGQIFDQNAMTVAHRTLPMNTLAKVTNLQTGQSAVVRVTDRGPFVPGRILDLSVASAKATGVWRPGLARVRIDVYQTPATMADGGRWCVQIGAFKDSGKALDLRDHLLRKYHTANVIEFAGPTGYWVRIRPLNDDKGRAAEIAGELRPEQGEAYLVRLD